MPAFIGNIAVTHVTFNRDPTALDQAVTEVIFVTTASVKAKENVLKQLEELPQSAVNLAYGQPMEPDRETEVVILLGAETMDVSPFISPFVSVNNMIQVALRSHEVNAIIAEGTHKVRRVKLLKFM